MRRFILDTGIAAWHRDCGRGVLERAAAEVARGNPAGIAAPVFAELAFRAEGRRQRERCIVTPTNAGCLETLAGRYRRLVI